MTVGIDDPYVSPFSAFKYCDLASPPRYFEECPDDNKRFLPIDRSETWMVIYLVTITMIVTQAWGSVPKVRPVSHRVFFYRMVSQVFRTVLAKMRPKFADLFTSLQDL